jgi:molybdopterin-guanine dinucleotide biosynthesis protein
LIVVGGHTRSIGKTQLVCDLIAALPSANWLAGKITQYGHGVCATNGHDCDCAPTEHIVALDWESNAATGTDSARFLQAGASRSFWLRTKQGYLAEGMPPLREALASAEQSISSDGANVIVESNSLLQFVKPSLYVTVLDTTRDDFKDSARQMLDRADVFVFRRGLDDGAVTQPPWMQIPASLLRQKPSLLQREGEPLPEPLFQLVKRILQSPASVFL